MPCQRIGSWFMPCQLTWGD